MKRFYNNFVYHNNKTKMPKHQRETFCEKNPQMLSKKDYTFLNLKMQFRDSGKNYPGYMIQECVDIFLKNEKEGGQVRLEMEETKITIMDNKTRQIYGVVKQKNEGLKMHMPKKINQELFEKLSEFKDTYKEMNEHFIFWHNHLETFMVGRVEEHIAELSRIGFLHGNLILKDCNIRTTKCDGEKFYRVTYIAPEGKDLGLSVTELAFGHHIDGITYIFPETIFKKHKDLILQCVDYEKTEFGKNTRWDINGNVYKKQKNKKGKKNN